MGALDKIREERREKKERFEKEGINPYPVESGRTHSLKEAIEGFEDLSEVGETVVLCGRIRLLREHGRITFLEIEDGTGRIQAMLKEDNLGEERYDFFLENFDLGDFVEIGGRLMTTRTGERTIEAERYKILSKSLRPLPEKWHRLKDVELRHRKRYLDLLVNPEVFHAFQVRSKITASLRRQLRKAGFAEIETPILQSQAGGAIARPFKTHLNALDEDFYLRIAPELYLKMLLVGGYEKVFELGKVFRNEGFSPKHNPEYTLLEIYEAYADYEDMMKLAQDLLSGVARESIGKEKFEFHGREISFERPWKRKTMRELILEKTSLDIDEGSREDIISLLPGEEFESLGRGKLIDKLFEKEVESHLIQPTFVCDLPIELSPLAKSCPEKPGHVERFELYIAGYEVANAYSELNDPVEQKERFLIQARAREEYGEKETHPFDRNFIEALEYGMPPAGGIGIGVDRLVLLLGDLKNIRETILFPIMKPK